MSFVFCIFQHKNSFKKIKKCTDQKIENTAMTYFLLKLHKSYEVKNKYILSNFDIT